MTRSHGDLVLCVDEPTFERFQTVRRESVAAFDCFTADEFVVGRGVWSEPATVA